LTLTRGERGEVVPGPHADLAGTPELAGHREGELRAALAALGVTQHAFLGTSPALRDFAEPRAYQDSGMVWQADGWAGPAEDAGEQALTARPAHEAIADAIEYVIASEATCVVSYDARGGYGHPDHVYAHRLARAVAHGLDLPFWEIVADASPRDAEAEIVAHDITPWLDRKREALGAHATQLTVTGPEEIVHSGGQPQQIARTESFLRVGR
ncbi:PIG-L family deacetylase, partial [Leucobacter sp. M11]|uniref:PIG-L family deacetylase n=1 Tax=Leucobacter sp. M11 TaxID=2993565 RepID=UPI002D801D1B